MLRIIQEDAIGCGLACMVNIIKQSEKLRSKY